MMHEPGQAFTNLAKIQDELKAYGAGGFFDAVAVKSGTIAERYLSLDQAMVMGAIGNVLADNVIRRAFSTADVKRALQPGHRHGRVRRRHRLAPPDPSCASGTP